MADALLSVSFAGPLITFQDAGRPGNMRYGISNSGPMDRLAFDAAHAALGNAPGQTAIEISLGGLILHCNDGSVTVAITGGDFVVEHAGQEIRSWSILTISKGERLAIRAGPRGSWAYLAFTGELQTHSWLNSQATHSTSGLGGGTLRSGDTIELANTVIKDDRHGNILPPDLWDDGAFQVVMGPQDHHFDHSILDRFLTGTFQVSDAYDRMGMRLSGPDVPPRGALSIPSEPIARGSVQVSGDGTPTILMADHQTTGGYPKIATLLSSETDRLAQFRAGQPVRFISISSEQAVIKARAFGKSKQQYLDEIGVARGTLDQRLMRENLIHGFSYD
ncbi:MAG: biotin-dependent carboxyltransferase family protein [Sedimentitalea sp.]